MKVSREQAARNRDAIVDAASHLFRQRGVDGVGISEVMQAAGLTHGGFYNQFAAKDALAAEACRRALTASAERWQAIVAQARPGEAAAAIAEDYLSVRQRDRPETGCALIALGADAARHGGDLAGALRDGLADLVDVLARAEGRADGQAEGRAAALAQVAQMVGAMMLARAVHDEALSLEIMQTARTALIDPA